MNFFPCIVDLCDTIDQKVLTTLQIATLFKRVLFVYYLDARNHNYDSNEYDFYECS